MFNRLCGAKNFYIVWPHYYVNTMMKGIGLRLLLHCMWMKSADERTCMARTSGGEGKGIAWEFTSALSPRAVDFASECIEIRHQSEII